MTLAPGTRFGAYQITGELGAGGMGEVYRATDLKLGREAAIKTLPSALAQDPDRLARFEREAKLLAALNHAHIAAVYGLDEHEGTQYLAMELVEGETLEYKLEAGPLPTEDTLHLARQIAEALEAAHDKGVVHRDLKPANIMVTGDGQVKVLDFGLAKAFSGDPNDASPAHSPALSMAMTQQGLILGTAGYMSPEQASGQATDQRTDIWAFGVVLYEMLTGLPVFSGESVPHILAAVLQTEPDWSRLPKNLHPRLKLLLERCLEKKVRGRYHSIADARVDIEQVLSDPRGVTPAADRQAAASPRSIASRAAIALVLFAAGAGVAGLVGWRLLPSSSAPPVTRFSDAIEPIGAAAPYLTISRDGSRIAYVAGAPPALYVRDIGKFAARQLVDDARDVNRTSMCFSPDGSWIAFTMRTQDRNSALSKMPVAGGTKLTLAEGLSASGPCDWADDGNVYFGGRGIERVPEAGGAVEAVVTPDAGGGNYTRPQLLPGGKELLFSIVADDGSVRVVIRDLKTQQQTTLLERAGLAVFAPTGRTPTSGHLIYARDRSLFAAPVDLSRRHAGAASQVLDGILGSGFTTFGAVSSTGTLAYLAGSPGAANDTVVVVDRHGPQQPLAEQATGFATGVALSPDGRHSVTTVFDAGSNTVDLWVYDFDGGRQTRATFAGINGNAVWTPDSGHLIYANRATFPAPQEELRSLPIDRSGAPVTLWRIQGSAVPTSVSPDGKVLMGTGLSSAGNNSDIWMLPLDAEPSGDAVDADIGYLLTTPFDERHATFSPDGHWVAFSSDESGREEVYVVPYPGPGPKSKVSVDGGGQPRWNPAGGELFYLNGSRLMAVEVETAPGFRAGAPKVLFDDASFLSPDPGNNPNAFQYDVTPGGMRFIMLEYGEGAESGSQLRVVQNWFEELRELVPLTGAP